MEPSPGTRSLRWAAVKIRSSTSRLCGFRSSILRAVGAQFAGTTRVYVNTGGNPGWWHTPETVRSGKARVQSRHRPADGASDFHVEASLPGGSYQQKTDALTLQATAQRSECLLQQQSGLRDSDRRKRLRALGFMLSFGRVTDRQTLHVKARCR